MAVQLGKRYAQVIAEFGEDGTPKVDDKGQPVTKNGVELLVIKPGDCNLFYEGVPMALMQPKVLPSAD